MKEKTKTKHYDRLISILCSILCVLLLPILIINLILIIKGAVNKNELPSIFGISPLAVETDSMIPIFSGGDLILIQKCESSNVCKNDIISFYEPSVLDHSVIVTHRVVEVRKNDDETLSFVTKGDANNTNDAMIINEELVIGKFICSLRGVGQCIMFLSTTKGMLLCVVLPMGVLLGFDYIKRFLCKSEKRTNKNCQIND